LISSMKTTQDTSTVYETKTFYDLYSMTYVSDQFFLKNGDSVGDPVTNNPARIKTKEKYTRIYRRVNRE